MKPRGTLILVLLAAALGAGYWYWEVKSKPAREQAAEDAKRLFPDMKAESTGEVLLRKDKDPDVLLRRVDGQWRLIQPVQAPADQAAVAALLEQLHDMKRDEVVEEKGGDLHKFGLDAPSGAVTFTPLSPNAKAQVLFFGMDSFDGSKAYGLIDGQPAIFLTALAGKTAILKNADGLRDKSLANFEEAQVVAVHSTIGAGFSLDKDAKGAWRVSAGGRTEPGDAGKISAWLQQLKGLKGDQVVDEAGKDPGRYGLGAAKVELSFGGKEKQAFIKGKLKDKGPAFYLKMQGLPQVWAMPAGADTALKQEGKALMELRAFQLQAGLVERVSFWQHGTTLTARRKEDLTWAWDKAPKPVPGQKPLDFPDFIAKAAGAERIKTLAPSAKPTHPLALITFFDKGDHMTDIAWLGPHQDGGQVVYSGRKDLASIVANNLFDLLPQPPDK